MYFCFCKQQQQQQQQTTTKEKSELKFLDVNFFKTFRGSFYPVEYLVDLICYCWDTSTSSQVWTCDGVVLWF